MLEQLFGQTLRRGILSGQIPIFKATIADGAHVPAYVPVDRTAMVLNSLDIFANHERGSVEIAVAGAGIAQVDGIACARAAVAALITPDSAAAEPIVPTVKTPT